MGLPFGKAPELPLGCRPWLQHAPHAGESVDHPNPAFAPHDHPDAPARLRAGSISPLASALGLSPSACLGLFPSGARSPKRRIGSRTETNAFGSPRFPCLRPGSNLPSPFRPELAPASGRPRLLTPRLQQAPNPQLRPAPSPDFRWPAPSHLSRFWTSSRSPPTPSITTTHEGFTPPSLAPPTSSSRPPRRVSVFSHRATGPQHSDHSAADHDSYRRSSSPSATSSSCQAPPPFLSPFPSLCRNSEPEPSSRVQFSVPASSHPTCMGPKAACMGSDHARPDHARPKPPAPELPSACSPWPRTDSSSRAPLGLLPSASAPLGLNFPLGLGPTRPRTHSPRPPQVALELPSAHSPRPRMASSSQAPLGHLKSLPSSPRPRTASSSRAPLGRLKSLPSSPRPRTVSSSRAPLDLPPSASAPDNFSCQHEPAPTCSVHMHGSGAILLLFHAATSQQHIPSFPLSLYCAQGAAPTPSCEPPRPRTAPSASGWDVNSAMQVNSAMRALYNQCSTRHSWLQLQTSSFAPVAALWGPRA